jgi:hypothetical protein
MNLGIGHTYMSFVIVLPLFMAVTVTCPCDNPFTTPLFVMERILSSLDAHCVVLFPDVILSETFLLFI